MFDCTEKTSAGQFEERMNDRNIEADPHGTVHSSGVGDIYSHNNTLDYNHAIISFLIIINYAIIIIIIINTDSIESQKAETKSC